MIIYKTTNLINCKIYIGLDTKNNQNYFGSGLHIGRAIKKYGKINFKKETIDTANSFEELCKKEIYWINELNSLYPNGYNLTKGGVGSFGRKASEETKRKIGNSKINNKNCVGRIISQETRNKMSDKKKNFKPSLNAKNSLSNKMNEMWKDDDYKNQTLKRLHKKVKCSFCDYENNAGNLAIHIKKNHVENNK